MLITSLPSGVELCVTPAVCVPNMFQEAAMDARDSLKVRFLKGCPPFSFIPALEVEKWLSTKQPRNNKGIVHL